MKLLTAGIIRKLERQPLGSQDGKGDDAKVLVKFFGGGAYTFLVTEAEKRDGDWLLFGKATFGYGWEWGYALMSELQKLRFPPFGLGIERDMYLPANTKVGDVAA